MTKDGLVAFERQVKACFEAAKADEDASEHVSPRDPAYMRRRWGDVLRTIYTRQRDVHGRLREARCRPRPERRAVVP
jgi:hypothetical protein